MADPGQGACDRRYRRSPLLLMQWDADEVQIVDAHTLRATTAHPALVAFLTSVSEWVSHAELVGRGFDVTEADLSQLVGLGLLEDSTHDIAGRWQPHELAVHRRTAVPGISSEPGVGPSARAHSGSGALQLETPPPLHASLDEVLAARRTQRTYGAPSMSLAQISALLYFSARTLDVVSRPSGLSVAYRPFASAGGRSELEIYVLSNNVDELVAGAYHYDPAAHALGMVRRADEWQEHITRSVGVAAGGTLNRPPPAVLIITAVFERMNNKYGHLGLSLIYKNVGCLFQNLYLVATALGLAPCAIGNGEESANSEWLGLDPLVESQVGCFLVGSR